jgi:penicillin-binding protein 1A
MQRALAKIPQQPMEMPEGLTSIDGDLFFADKTPGNGFVASIGLDTANPAEGSSDAVGGVGPGGMTPPPPPDVAPAERQEIMNLFKGH